MKPPKKVAIFDDDADILEALQLTFGYGGYETRASLKGEEAGKIISEFKPDAIVMDVLLSGKDGRDICKALKKDDLTKGIPVIMISARSDVEKTVLDVGADGFLAKPFDIDKLLQLVGKHIG